VWQLPGEHAVRIFLGRAAFEGLAASRARLGYVPGVLGQAHLWRERFPRLPGHLRRHTPAPGTSPRRNVPRRVAMVHSRGCHSTLVTISQELFSSALFFLGCQAYFRRAATGVAFLSRIVAAGFASGAVRFVGFLAAI